MLLLLKQQVQNYPASGLTNTRFFRTLGVINDNFGRLILEAHPVPNIIRGKVLPATALARTPVLSISLEDYLNYLPEASNQVRT